MAKNKSRRVPYEIRWKPLNGGRDGGYGKVKSFIAHLSDPNQASKKLRQPGQVVSVRRAR